MNKDKYGLSLKLEKSCRANKEKEFKTLCKQFLKRYRGSKILKTAGVKPLIAIHSLKFPLDHRNNF